MSANHWKWTSLPTCPFSVRHTCPRYDGQLFSKRPRQHFISYRRFVKLNLFSKCKICQQFWLKIRVVGNLFSDSLAAAKFKITYPYWMIVDTNSDWYWKSPLQYRKLALSNQIICPSLLIWYSYEVVNKRTNVGICQNVFFLDRFGQNAREIFESNNLPESRANVSSQIRKSRQCRKYY